ncbi:MAG: XTP/dITP diphosphatase [Pirellulaceae bacterium]|nr:XTP/dITP diphosphatase [Pirellulaceae bacterium]
MQNLVLASRNSKKTKELATLFAPAGIHLLNVHNFPTAPHVEETGATFAENAAQKASQVASSLTQWTLADDSGLAVAGLNGAPGVHSARYAGEPSSDRRNNEKLLQQISSLPTEQRTAQFVCHLVIADPTGKIYLRAEAACRGRILSAPQGTIGFGYDPLFLVPEYSQTFAELSLAVKNCLSHRARAFRQLLRKLAKQPIHSAEADR